MDVNNTRFHLIYGQADWERCLEETASMERPLVRWDEEHTQTLTLCPKPLLFPRGKRDVPLEPSARRGAAVDGYSNWYWIGHDRQKIFWSPAASRQPLVYWAQKPEPQCTEPGAFRPVDNGGPSVVELGGLAVTEHHYLVVGNVTQGGLFLFDLHSRSQPLLLLFPTGVSLEPFDLAAAPGGGVWVLDRNQHAYWGLDRWFRIVTEPGLMPDVEPDEPFVFRPDGEEPIVCPSPQFPEGFGLAAQDPISIEALPDGSVLILDRPPSETAPSTLHHYRLSQQLSGSLPLPGLKGIAASEEMRPVVGHDMAYVPARDRHEAYVPLKGTLYVVERDGNQAIAFLLDLESAESPPEPIGVKREYLPMHSSGGRALVAWEDEVFYDVVGGPSDKDTAVSWVQLRGISRPRYERTGTLFTPILDGRERDCVWHRLFLDACIPSEASVRVWTRVVNAKDLDEARILLEGMPFTPEPSLYLRGAGSELSYYQPYPNRKPLPENTGTWELLFQEAHGRYLQIQLELSGNGRVTPQLQALRAHYPRFSYPRRFLPAVYQEDQESGLFLERLLANLEGFYTEIEGKIAEVSMLFDPRSAPPETLDWLARWIGLVLDPLWAGIQERRQGDGLAADRRRLFIRYAIRLFDQRGTPNGIRFALHLLLHPCLEALLERFKNAAVRPDLGLADELERLGLPYPVPTMSEVQMEDLLQDYLLAPRRPSSIRIAERFLTRGGRALVAGDPTEVGQPANQSETILDSAHRFSVLIPDGISAEEEAMVQRIVELEKPAHTWFDVRRYWDYFRVGEVRLGLDTVLGEGGRFAPMILGRDRLAQGYLYPAHPMDVSERLVSDRDRLGERPL